MKVGIRLPKLGATMTEGKVVKWIAKPGDAVQPGDILCEVESDKAVLDIECPWEATVTDILIEADQVIPVGTVICNVAKG